MSIVASGVVCINEGERGVYREKEKHNVVKN